jgi:hypothetical protein
LLRSAINLPLHDGFYLFFSQSSVEAVIATGASSQGRAWSNSSEDGFCRALVTTAWGVARRRSAGKTQISEMGEKSYEEDSSVSVAVAILSAGGSGSLGGVG